MGRHPEIHHAAVPSLTVLPPLSRLYRESFDDVWAILRRLGVPDACLEDAVHDVFVVVHRRRAAFKGNCAVRTWLFGIARRVAFRYRRTEARTQRRHRALAVVQRIGFDAHEHLELREAWVALQRFLDGLDRSQREAFVLGELQRLNRRELGAALGVNPNTAYSRLRAARARFSETFADGRPPGSSVLSAGRRQDPVPKHKRQRIWVGLSSSLGMVPAATGSVAASAFGAGAKAVLTGVGLGGALLGLAAAVTLDRGSSTVGDARPTAKVFVTAAVHPASGRKPIGVSPFRPGLATPAPAAGISPPAAKLPRASRSSVAGSPRTDELSLEAKLLREARAQLAQARPAEALGVLREHRRRFELGALAEERDASIIRAQCALGLRSQARDEAHRFVAKHPRSAYLEALAQTCAASVINLHASGDSPK